MFDVNDNDMPTTITCDKEDNREITVAVVEYKRNRTDHLLAYRFNMI